jgi:hypothetical protein
MGSMKRADAKVDDARPEPIEIIAGPADQCSSSVERKRAEPLGHSRYALLARL